MAERYIPHSNSPVEMRRAIQQLEIALSDLEDISVPSYAAGEDIEAGMPLYMPADGKLYHARADDLDKSEVCGVASGSASEGGQVEVVMAGIVSLENWTDAIGAVELTAGTIYYLAETGGLTAVVPTTINDAFMLVGRALSVNDLEVLPGRPTKL